MKLDEELRGLLRELALSDADLDRFVAAITIP